MTIFSLEKEQNRMEFWPTENGLELKEGANASACLARELPVIITGWLQELLVRNCPQRLIQALLVEPHFATGTHRDQVEQRRHVLGFQRLMHWSVVEKPKLTLELSETYPAVTFVSFSCHHQERIFPTAITCGIDKYRVCGLTHLNSCIQI